MFILAALIEITTIFVEIALKKRRKTIEKLQNYPKSPAVKKISPAKVVPLSSIKNEKRPSSTEDTPALKKTKVRPSSLEIDNSNREKPKEPVSIEINRNLSPRVNNRIRAQEELMQ